MQKTIIITGCSSGIGLVTAQILKQRGYRVFATARKHEDVENLKNQGFESEQLDLGNSLSIQQAVKNILGKTDHRVYALFNNGAYGQPGAVEDLSRHALREQFETNLFGTQELTNLLIPCMRKQGEGRIIQNSSVLGFVALKYRGAYVASKFALEGLSDTMRMELEGTGLYVSIIEPGPIRSAFRKNAYDMYRKNIDKDNSAHKEIYYAIEKKLQLEEDVAPFTLDANTVAEKVIHALESNHPKLRYYVTKPTYMFAYLKRILPERIMDWILLKVSGSENKKTYNS